MRLTLTAKMSYVSDVPNDDSILKNESEGESIIRDILNQISVTMSRMK